jgi:hypothetical protein
LSATNVVGSALNPTQRAASYPALMDRYAAAGLVRLRAALVHAKSIAVDQSDHGRHVALITLDGVCEYAMWLAIDRLGLSVDERSGFPDALKQLVNHPKCKGFPTRRGVLQLHRARNHAQHAGVMPDPSLIPGWTEEVDAFVRFLVEAAFAVDLETVLLADAVEDKALREQVASAELAVSAEDPSAGFSAAYEVFKTALRRWHEQQADALSYYSIPTSAGDAWEPQSTTEDYADVGVFTTDLGEYHWLLATHRKHLQGVPLDLEDARRALLFAYHWILRWQTFDAKYPSERWRSFLETVGPPSTGDGDTPQIINVKVPGRKTIGAGEYIEVITLVANIPQRGRDDWGYDIQQSIERAASQVGVSKEKIVPGPRTATGNLTFFFDPTLTEDQIRELLPLTITEATELYRGRRTERDERDRVAGQHVDAVREVLADADSDLFGEVTASYQLRPTGEVTVISVDYRGSRMELADLVAIFHNREGILKSTFATEGGLAFDAFDMSQENRSTLAEALQAAAHHVALTREAEATRETERQRLEYVLQRYFGGSSAQGSPTA